MNKNFVVIGESGSGKSEFAINLAIWLAHNSKRPVRLFDMDQTKPMFRTRDAKSQLHANGVEFEYELQFMDARVVPHGVVASLQTKELNVVLDIGGSMSGALCLGQYQSYLESGQAVVFYLINPYRCFSDTLEHISQTMCHVQESCGLTDICLVCNPYCGNETTASMVINGYQQLKLITDKLNLHIKFLLVPQWVPIAKIVIDEVEICQINRYLPEIENGYS